MRSHNESKVAKPINPIRSVWILGARLTCIVLAPVVLGFTTILIVANGTGWLTRLDLVFAVAAALMLFGRWVEFRSGCSTSLCSGALTPNDFRPWVTWFSIVAIAIWMIANILGNHMLT